MIVYLYKWRIKAGKEQQFEDAWKKVTIAFRAHCGSYGSRLHVASSGEWVGYAQWPDLQTRENCKPTDPDTLEAQQQMRDATAESFPAVSLEIKSDFLIHN